MGSMKMNQDPVVKNNSNRIYPSAIMIDVQFSERSPIQHSHTHHPNIPYVTHLFETLKDRER